MVVEIDPSPSAEAGPGKNYQKGQNRPPEVIDGLQAGRGLLNASADGTRLLSRVHRRERQASRQGGPRLAPVGRENGFLPPGSCGGTVVLMMLVIDRHIEVVRDENPTQGAGRLAGPAEHRCMFVGEDIAAKYCEIYIGKKMEKKRI